MSKPKYIWKVTYKSEGVSIIDYYTMISKVNALKHLLVCAGYNESSDSDTYQQWLNIDQWGNCKEFTFDRDIANLSLLSRKV